MALRESDLPSSRLDLLDVDTVAALIRQTPEWVRSQTRARCKDQMPHMKRGRRLFFDEAKVLAWFEKGSNTKPRLVR